MELEIDGAGELKKHARLLLEVGNQEGEYLYIKHDGSLDDGMELVTHPASLDYQLHHVPWAKLCGKAVSLGYLSHQANTCGLHVHVSRSAFGAESWEQDLAIARVLYFFEKHWEELMKFSRRTPRQLERWAARYGYKEQPMEILDYAKKGYHGGRYTCVNLQNPDTVEFRMFRGTLKVNTIFATLEMLNCICDAAIFLSDDEMKSLAWTTFVSGIQTDQYPELIQHLKAVLKNLEWLQVALQTGETEFPTEKREKIMVPFRALPVILGSKGSRLSGWPDMIAVRVSRVDFDTDLCEKVMGSSGFGEEYWAALTGYVGERIPQLQAYLREGIVYARRAADDQNLSSV